MDKWFWRSFHLFAIVTGFGMDYFTPLDKRERSFKEFMEEWVLGQFLAQLDPRRVQADLLLRLAQRGRAEVGIAGISAATGERDLTGVPAQVSAALGEDQAGLLGPAV